MTKFDQVLESLLAQEAFLTGPQTKNANTAAPAQVPSNNASQGSGTSVQPQTQMKHATGAVNGPNGQPIQTAGNTAAPSQQAQLDPVEQKEYDDLLATSNDPKKFQQGVAKIQTDPDKMTRFLGYMAQLQNQKPAV